MYRTETKNVQILFFEQLLEGEWKMGKKILTEEEIERRKCAGHHVKAYRTEMGWTQEKCAEEWDINLMKLRRPEMNIEE